MTAASIAARLQRQPIPAWNSRAGFAAIGAMLAIAALGGYWLGRHRGKVVVSALSAFAATAVAEQVNEMLGDEVL